MNLNIFVGQKIKHLRESHSMTQDELADKLETTRQTISRYETGDRKTNQDTLFELGKIFGVSINYFFPNEEDTEKHEKEVSLDDAFDNHALFTYQGKKIPDEDLDVIKRILESRRDK